MAALTAFQTAYSAAEVAKAAAGQAVSEKDEARAYLELMLNQRAIMSRSPATGTRR